MFLINKYFVTVIAIIYLALLLMAIGKLLKASKPAMTMLSKGLWFLIIIFIPFLGALVYIILNRQLKKNSMELG